jgi:hypothetical protein
MAKAGSVEELFDQVDLDSGSRSPPSNTKDDGDDAPLPLDSELAAAIEEGQVRPRKVGHKRLRLLPSPPPLPAQPPAPTINVARRQYYSQATRQLYSGGRTAPGLPALSKTAGTIAKKKKTTKRFRPKPKRKPPTAMAMHDYEDREERAARRGAGAETGDRE